MDRHTSFKLVETEREKLLHLSDILHKRVVGQDKAVDLVSDAVVRARAGIKDPTDLLVVSYS
ncbi:chaperone protein ClpB [Staphylococcus aureus]|uniref:Chaperone protein ClpB n=1 Tax=Staphylococcus aureus TaxID=1280 RepID=A0A380EI21_STAAU|nr:chaperone protein ClpB [Staphylococcus aureus]